MRESFEAGMQSIFGTGMLPVFWTWVASQVARLYYVRLRSMQDGQEDPFRSSIFMAFCAASLTAVIAEPATVRQGVLFGLASGAIVGRAIAHPEAA